jgi:putative ABC transport system permease protein
VVNERLASKHWPGQSALGKRVSFNGPSGPWFSIVGVVGDVQQTAPGAKLIPHIYRPMGQLLGSSLPLNMSAVIRAKGNPAALRESVARALADLDPDLATARVAPMEDVVSSSLQRQKAMSLLFVLFASVALLLSAVGIYGLMSFVARQRTREIGIRMALGASVRDVVKLILGQGTRFVLLGAVVGLLAAAALTRVLEHLLGNLASGDLPTYFAVTALLGLVALIACLLPALRAAKVDPMIALRSE